MFAHECALGSLILCLCGPLDGAASACFFHRGGRAMSQFPAAEVYHVVSETPWHTTRKYGSAGRVCAWDWEGGCVQGVSESVVRRGIRRGMTM